jgi:hypothetical protein
VRPELTLYHSKPHSADRRRPLQCGSRFGDRALQRASPGRRFTEPVMERDVGREIKGLQATLISPSRHSVKKASDRDACSRASGPQAIGGRHGVIRFRHELLNFFAAPVWPVGCSSPVWETIRPGGLPESLAGRFGRESASENHTLGTPGRTVQRGWRRLVDYLHAIQPCYRRNSPLSGFGSSFPPGHNPIGSGEPLFYDLKPPRS